MSWGMVIGGAIAAGGALLSSSKSSKAAKSAANTQSEAADAATQAQLEMYYKSREDIAPWTAAGGKAITQALETVNNPETYVKSPYYNFLFDEGMKARERAASATGKLGSGAFVKDAEKFGQGLASTDFGNYVNYLMGIAGMGQTSAGQSANLSTVTGNNIASNILTAGDARASGYINQANASAGGVQGVTNAVSSGLNNYLFYSKLPQQYKGATSAGSTGSGGASQISFN